MASSPLSILLLLLLLSISSPPPMAAEAQMVEIDPSIRLSMVSYPFGAEDDGDLDLDDVDDDDSSRRGLLWRHVRRHHYYISYGALSANRIPCPARSGRSYYTHNCYRARGPPRPYSRGCSAITRCRR